LAVLYPPLGGSLCLQAIPFLLSFPAIAPSCCLLYNHCMHSFYSSSALLLLACMAVSVYTIFSALHTTPTPPACLQPACLPLTYLSLALQHSACITCRRHVWNRRCVIGRCRRGRMTCWAVAFRFLPADAAVTPPLAGIPYSDAAISFMLGGAPSRAMLGVAGDVSGGRAGACYPPSHLPAHAYRTAACLSTACPAYLFYLGLRHRLAAFVAYPARHFALQACCILLS